jgi:magnesium transporter
VTPTTGVRDVAHRQLEEDALRVAARTKRAAIAGRRFGSATEVAVLEGERLVGVVGIERLLAAPDGTPVGGLADSPEVVSPEADLEAVTRQAARSGGRSVAVVDAEGRFHGLVPAGRLLCVFELEHEEDLARLGGFFCAGPRRGWRRRRWCCAGCGIGCRGFLSGSSAR